MDADFKYQSGFGNHFESEALPGALPAKQNNPQKVAYGLYAEQLSGSAFTAPRTENFRTWFYRIRPSVMQGAYRELPLKQLRGTPFAEGPVSPNQLRWNPLAEPKAPVDFLDGLHTYCGNGDPEVHKGCAVHLYSFNRAMGDRFFYNADGEMLIVPEKGKLLIRTECGPLEVSPKEIAILPKGLKFQINPKDGWARGYVCENFGAPFRLPYLGPIGANSLANARHFLAPSAAFEDKQGNFKLAAKFLGRLWECDLDHSPLDVVAWYGNYVPYKYDLTLFQAVGSVDFDHPDPSIFTVLTSPSEIAGTANVDFVIFPPRWMVAEHTFRPPYFHRNCMSEVMGLIHGVYDAKAQGFVPGGLSLHNCMSPHGPDAETFEKASHAELKPQHQGNTLAFMFESSLVFKPTRLALESPLLQPDYLSCWQGLKRHFDSKG